MLGVRRHQLLPVQQSLIDVNIVHNVRGLYMHVPCTNAVHARTLDGCMKSISGAQPSR